ncbi:hypothetical protein FOMPIDRAFT_1087719, partial [Fomitopsis schrenkii]
YEMNSRANRISLKWQFYGYHHDPSFSIERYCTEIKDLAAKLRAIGVTVSDTDITDVLISNLHETWSIIASALMATKDELTVQDVSAAL